MQAAATLLALAAVGLACAPSEPVLTPVARLVELVRDAGALHSERIAGETRPVLRGYPTTSVRIALEPSAEPVVELRHASGVLAGSTEAIVSGSVRFGAEWEPFEPRRVAVEELPEGPGFVLELAAPGARAGSVFATARVPIGAEEQRIDLPPLDTPRAAELRFGFGVPEISRNQGGVVFRVSACRAAGCDTLFEENLDTGHESAARWQDRRVSLREFSGERIALRFESRHQVERPGSWALPLWSDPVVFAPGEREPADWNVLLISLDTLRADHLSSYGYARDTAPFLREYFDSQGAVFERAVSAASSTLPSHVSLFTSLQPSVHGLRENSVTRTLSDRVTTLASALREAGYRTAAITEGGAISAGTGVERGFGSYRESAWSRGGVEPTLEAAREWLASHADQRFFLFLHTYQAHVPYEPPAEYLDLFAGDRVSAYLPDRLPADWHPDQYDREIRYIDDALRRFFAAPEVSRLLNRTLVVVTSDHGEAFLEHGYLAHGSGLHQEVLHVPLLVSGPGVAAGRRIAARVGLIDLMPTLLEWVGAASPGGMMGRSFAGLLRGQAAPADWDARPVFSEAWQQIRFVPEKGGVELQRLRQPSYAVQLGPRKLIHLKRLPVHAYEYYDLASDPGERRDRYPAARSEMADLRSLLDRYRAETSRLHEDLSAAPESTLDPGRESQLRALGYLE